MLVKNSRYQRAFTLIEVLVALAIIAVALAAAARAAGLMTQTQGSLRDRELAWLSAQARVAELRLQADTPGQLTNGARSLPCDQGRLRLTCTQQVSAVGNRGLLQVRLQVNDASGQLASVETLIQTRLSEAEATP